MSETGEVARRLDEVADRLRALARSDVELGSMTTYRVGGRASVFVEVSDEADLAEVIDAIGRHPVPVLIIGNGSNLLVSDRGFIGLALYLGEGFAGVTIDDTVVRAGGAALLPLVARRTASAGLTGFEWAVGVPGSIGGAVRMNAGGHGSDMAASLTRVRVVDLCNGEDEVMPASSLDLRYRSSSLRAAQIVVWAELELDHGNSAESLAKISEIVRWRRENQPGGQNAGSVFTNPPGESAGHLIDLAGCKGLRVGSAEVSVKHANFIQTDERGSAEDVYQLMREVQRRVRARTGILLEPETRLVGFTEPRIE